MINDKETIQTGWRALEMSPDPKKSWIQKYCRCDPEVNMVPCEYCALFNALKVADRLLEEVS
jgi:hypothetical protein